MPVSVRSMEGPRLAGTITQRGVMPPRRTRADADAREGACLLEGNGSDDGRRKRRLSRQAVRGDSGRPDGLKLCPDRRQSRHRGERELSGATQHADAGGALVAWGRRLRHRCGLAAMHIAFRSHGGVVGYRRRAGGHHGQTADHGHGHQQGDGFADENVHCKTRILPALVERQARNCMQGVCFTGPDARSGRAWLACASAEATYAG